MDAAASPLILTKLSLPAARPRMVCRTRLVSRLAPETGTGLLLVCAPAGYGKTTLLAEWARSLAQDGVAVAWYALDAGDDDPTAFGSYLVAALAASLNTAPELAHAAQLLRSSPDVNLGRLLPIIINAVISCGRKCVLVLDDYHLIGAPAIHSAVALLLEHLPESMHIAIGSRSDPPLPLARLRARGQLLELRAADLRFSGDETALFLNESMRLALSPELVGALEARTEGWIAGLQLAALSLSGRPDKEGFISSFTGSQRYLVEYLLDEVVARQPEQVQIFLLTTSILDRLCGPLCDAVLSEGAEEWGSAKLSPSEGQAVLEQLDQDNLFVVSLDDQGRWYRYHHLFREFLQAQLQKTRPGRVIALHRAASEWHSAHGFLREAVRHAFETGDIAYATTVVLRHSFPMMMRGEVSTVYEWCTALPEAVVSADPGLGILYGWALVLGFRGHNRRRVEEQMERVEKAAAALQDKALGRALADQASVVRAFLAMTPNTAPGPVPGLAPSPDSDPGAELAAAQRTLDALPEGDLLRFGATLTTGYAHLALQDAGAAAQALQAARLLALGAPVAQMYHGVGVTTADLARLAHAQGQLQAAAEICRQGQADIAAIMAPVGLSAAELPASGCLDIALGCVLLEQDRLPEAESALLRGLDLIGRGGMNPFYEMTACVGLHQLRVAQGRRAEGLAFLSRLEVAWPDIDFCTRGLRVVHALRTAPEDRRAVAEAAAWCRAFSPPVGTDARLPGMGPFAADEACYLAYLAWAEARIALGDAGSARPYLQRQIALAAGNGLATRLIELSLLEAQACRAEGDEGRARAAIERALAAGERSGYLRIFDQGPGLFRLLVEAAERGMHQPYVEMVLAAISRRPVQEARPAGAPASSIGAPQVAGARTDEGPCPEPAESLSERELEVLRLMAQGASNQDIANQLVITVGTVKSHINHILGKLGARNRTEAVARARGAGLIQA